MSGGDRFEGRDAHTGSMRTIAAEPLDGGPRAGIMAVVRPDAIHPVWPGPGMAERRADIGRRAAGTNTRGREGGVLETCSQELPTDRMASG